MAYTSPRTWANELVEASDFNIELRDNQLALKAPPSDNYESDEGLDYSTSAATFSNIDTDTNFTITTNGGDVMIGLNVTGRTGGAYIDVLLDGTRIVNQSAAGLVLWSSPTTASFCWLVTGLSADSHTFNFQFRVQGGGTLSIPAGAGTANYDVHPQFWVREIS